MYDEPMRLEEALGDEQRRRAALGYFGVPTVPVPPMGSETGNQSSEPARTTGADFTALAQQYLAAQQADRLDAMLSQAGDHANTRADNIYATATGGTPRPIVSKPLPSRAQDVEESAHIAALPLTGSAAKSARDAKPDPSDDPPSPASRHAQETYALTYPGRFKPEDLAKFSEADFVRLKLADKTPQVMGIEATATAAKNTNARAGERIKQDDVHFWAKMQQDAEQFNVSDTTRRYIADQYRMAAQAARDEATATKAKEKADAINVPGYEVAPDATPTVSDAQKMKDTNESALRMRGTIADLRALHRQYGENPKGTGADLQQQALRAVQMEAKNIVGLGALSGPDMGLMIDLSAQDANSIGSWVRRNFVGASMEEGRNGLERWMGTVVGATAASRGYRPKAQKPQRTTPDKVLPRDAAGNPQLAGRRPP